MRILLAPAQVQGMGAAKTIIDGIGILNGVEEVDVIIVGRGGGSYEDLSCFNDEALARAIFASEKPVVSAVGHEIDFTIADFVSDLRAPTPSAAAELCVPEFDTLVCSISDRQKRMFEIVDARLSSAKQQLKLLSSDSVLKKPTAMLDIKREILNSTVRLLEQRAGEAITGAYMRLENLEQRLEALNPFAVLKRGYAIVLRDSGKTLCRASDANVGEKLSIRFDDGSLEATVDALTNNKQH